MFHEIPNARQDETFDGTRRWFSDPDMDLIVWVAADDQIVGFQLCYDLQTHEHSLTWHRDRGFSHNRIDTGEEDPSVNRTPILVADGLFPFQRVDAEFVKRAGGMDKSLVDFVRQKLVEEAQKPV